MKIVVASDSFKGTLDATKISNIVQTVAEDMFGSCQVQKIPMADGGEGTVDALIEAMAGTKVSCPVLNPILQPIQAEYGVFDDTAIMEMASASGITLITDDQREIMSLSTYGTGQMIAHAMEHGYKNIYIGIGGSATNDGGIGFACALGAKFLDKDGAELEALPKNLPLIEDIDVSAMHPLLAQTNITVMTDVDNPLLGARGATHIFGKQKGADEATRELLEAGMTHYADVAERIQQSDVRNQAGSGAAGGLGFGLRYFTDAKLCSGVTTILGILKFKEQIADADLVITGEGRMDYQSAYGKVASGVGTLCKEQNVPCIAIVGSMGERADEMENFGIRSILPTVIDTMSLSQALAQSEADYVLAVRRALSLIKIGLEMNAR